MDYPKGFAPVAKLSSLCWSLHRVTLLNGIVIAGLFLLLAVKNHSIASLLEAVGFLCAIAGILRIVKSHHHAQQDVKQEAEEFRQAAFYLNLCYFPLSIAYIVHMLHG